MGEDIGNKVKDGLREFSNKLRRGDLIPTTRISLCTCEGLAGCNKCEGGFIREPAYLNDWSPEPGEEAT